MRRSAAWDSKYAYRRPRPTLADPALEATVAVPRSPSYPCERAVAAGAASEIMAYLWPTEASRFAKLAGDAAWSRVQAGVQYPSDVRAGLALGRAVASLVISRPGTAPTRPGWAPFRQVPATGGDRRSQAPSRLGATSAPRGQTGSRSAGRTDSTGGRASTPTGTARLAGWCSRTSSTTTRRARPEPTHWSWSPSTTPGLPPRTPAPLLGTPAESARARSREPLPDAPLV
jgi:hypothetical protein